MGTRTTTTNNNENEKRDLKRFKRGNLERVKPSKDSVAAPERLSVANKRAAPERCPRGWTRLPACHSVQFKLYLSRPQILYKYVKVSDLRSQISDTRSHGKSFFFPSCPNRIGRRSLDTLVVLPTAPMMGWSAEPNNYKSQRIGFRFSNFRLSIVIWWNCS